MAVWMCVALALALMAPSIAAGAVAGPRSTNTVVNDASTGSSAWSNPTAVDTSNDTRTTAGLDNSAGPPVQSRYLKATGFGFSIPAGSRIDGIRVEVERRKLVNGSSLRDAKVRIVKGGVIGSTDRSDLAAEWPTSDQYKSYGSATDLWGQTWTPADINSAGFGFAISAVGPASGNQTAAIDHIRVTVFYTLMQCADGSDNDGDGRTDYPNDPGCVGPADNDEVDPKPACSDGADNDGDGETDFPADLGCLGPNDDSEQSPIGPPSEECDSPTATVADGYAGSGTYVRLRVQEAADETWVCVRATNGSSLELGGRFVIEGASAGPVLDGDSGACSTTAGNQVPGPRPTVEGALGDPSSPPYVPFMLDSYAAGSDAWVCVEVGDFRQRVMVPGVQSPSVTFEPDDVPPPLPPPPPGDPANPSSTCQNGVGGSKEQVVNSHIADGHVWAYTWQPSADRVHICARADTPAAAGGLGVGGMLTIEASAPVEVSDDLSPCTVSVASLEQPVEIELSRSPGTSPTSLCVKAGSTQKRVTVDAGALPPSVTWAPDMGTPGLGV
jgi:hypothetical protein